jgi:hypothetical protein
VQLTATPKDAGGSALTGRIVTWASSATSVATVTGAGLVTGVAAGSVTITATSEGINGTSTVTVTAPTADPQPGASSRILFDTRTSLQQATTQSSAFALFNATNDGASGFTTDFDGHGTHAIRHEWTGYGGTCADTGHDIGGLFPSPQPTELYLQWNSWWGRTPTGGGIGNIGQFQIANGNCGNAGRKLMLLHRIAFGPGRFSLVLAGAAPVVPLWHYSSTIDWEKYTATDIVWQSQMIGTVITQTVYVKIASSDAATDGIIRYWVNGQLKVEILNAGAMTTAFAAFTIPTTYNSPQFDQTEYIWGVVAWVP